VRQINANHVFVTRELQVLDDGVETVVGGDGENVIAREYGGELRG